MKPGVKLQTEATELHRRLHHPGTLSSIQEDSCNPKDRGGPWEQPHECGGGSRGRGRRAQGFITCTVRADVQTTKRRPGKAKQAYVKVPGNRAFQRAHGGWKVEHLAPCLDLEPGCNGNNISDVQASTQHSPKAFAWRSLETLETAAG